MPIRCLCLIFIAEVGVWFIFHSGVLCLLYVAQIMRIISKMVETNHGDSDKTSLDASEPGKLPFLLSIHCQMRTESSVTQACVWSLSSLTSGQESISNCSNCWRHHIVLAYVLSLEEVELISKHPDKDRKGWVEKRFTLSRGFISLRFRWFMYWHQL